MVNTITVMKVEFDILPTNSKNDAFGSSSPNILFKITATGTTVNRSTILFDNATPISIKDLPNASRAIGLYFSGFKTSSSHLRSCHYATHNPYRTSARIWATATMKRQPYVAIYPPPAPTSLWITSVKTVIPHINQAVAWPAQKSLNPYLRLLPKPSSPNQPSVAVQPPSIVPLIPWGGSKKAGVGLNGYVCVPSDRDRPGSSWRSSPPLSAPVWMSPAPADSQHRPSLADLPLPFASRCHLIRAWGYDADPPAGDLRPISSCP